MGKNQYKINQELYTNLSKHLYFSGSLDACWAGEYKSDHLNVDANGGGREQGWQAQL